MRPAFNLERNYMVIMLTRKEWTIGPGTSPVVQGLVWFKDGSGMEGTGAGVYGQTAGRKFSISLGKYATG